MKIKIEQEQDWAVWKTCSSTDPYEARCLKFAEAWADAMEAAIAQGELLADCAQRLASEVNRRHRLRITDFMYGVAVARLARCWEHGEELRRWHNLTTRLHNGGKPADKAGAS